MSNCKAEPDTSTRLQGCQTGQEINLMFIILSFEFQMSACNGCSSHYGPFDFSSLSDWSTITWTQHSSFIDLFSINFWVVNLVKVGPWPIESPVADASCSMANSWSCLGSLSEGPDPSVAGW